LVEFYREEFVAGLTDFDKVREGARAGGVSGGFEATVLEDTIRVNREDPE
jgi:hypothetical protein